LTPPQPTTRRIRFALVAIAVLAALSYSWSINHDMVDAYYAATVRSMASSWHDFFFGAFDPAGTITIDKLPGAFWIQALSVRVFGIHTWALVLPQVLEGVGAVFALFRAVRRLAGPAAGLVAALLLAASPAIVTLDRGNISDSLMILLLVLAADAASAALTSGRLSHLLLAGLFVGLAFQAKMMEAWLVLPALGAAYLLAAPSPVGRRLRSILVLGVVTGVVSLLWMTAVTLTPASSRPYVDGSHHDSEYEQVFVYNGFGRLGRQTPMQLLARQSIGVAIPYPPPSWDRLVTGSPGRDAGWMLPAATFAGLFGLLSRRRRSRRDPIRAAIVLWGTWLVVFFGVLSVASNVNPYYAAVLAPPIAALVGVGATALWAQRHRRVSWAVVTGIVAGSTAYAAWLIPDGGTGVPAWLRPAVFATGCAASLGAVLVALHTPRGRGEGDLERRRPRAGVGAAVALCGAVAALMVVPVVASASVVARGEGMYDTPFESPGTFRGIDLLFVETLAAARRALPQLERARNGAPDLLATQTSTIAAGFAYTSGQEVLPIGGFTGTIPEPTLAQLKDEVATGRFHLVLAGRGGDPRIGWIASHCRDVGQPTPSITTYFCVPVDAR
jgi:4-amino-4-deoxy-L-arabinose transferase-like glycosyltransferase